MTGPFPEGEREFADGKLLPFKEGVVRIAAQAQVPILPVTVSGGDKVWPREQRYPRPFRRITVTYHSPLTVQGDDAAAEAANVRLREIIGSAL